MPGAAAAAVETSASDRGVLRSRLLLTTDNTAAEYTEELTLSHTVTSLSDTAAGDTDGSETDRR